MVDAGASKEYLGSDGFSDEDHEAEHDGKNKKRGHAQPGSL